MGGVPGAPRAPTSRGAAGVPRRARRLRRPWARLLALAADSENRRPGEEGGSLRASSTIEAAKGSKARCLRPRSP
eukprot:13232652-Alexandrium_andersonii.AAC.1